MQNFYDWFSRCQGDWKSYRRYLTLPAHKDNTYTTEFTILCNDNNKVSINWEGEASAGVMDMVIEDQMLHRNIGYFSDSPTDSKMSFIDDDTVLFESAYDGMSFREEIRLLDGDKARLRQTVGKGANGKVFLVGQYWEERT